MNPDDPYYNDWYEDDEDDRDDDDWDDDYDGGYGAYRDDNAWMDDDPDDGYDEYLAWWESLSPIQKAYATLKTRWLNSRFYRSICAIRPSTIDEEIPF
jgi:hypothetical protein